ncbi:MAG: exonuclease SbcCD subunit D [Sphaerobacteraceae bacterium]|nr:MAG: exonuclease SbcCD subunit D [Sphaerobacteraceae bacterium]
MRILHTADWHLGRLFHGTHLTNDQSHLLDQFIDLLADQKPDVIVLSGDVYDRAYPPVEAVELLDETLARIAIDHNIPMLIIAGNHDNPSRLEFGSRLMTDRGIYLFGRLTSCDTPIVLQDADGPVTFYLAPYCEPAEVRAHLQDDAAVCFDSAMRSLVGRHQVNGRSVLLSHSFVHGGSVSDSERPLSIGGADTVSADHFLPFSYVALGHLHQPQSFNGGRVRYSGSLMKYSFNEAAQRKSVSIVEIDAAGEIQTEEFQLTPRRDMRVIRGTLEELLQRPDDYGPRDDYLMATLLDEGAVYDAMGRLRDVYPNLMHLERAAQLEGDGEIRRASDIVGKSDLDLFNDFMQAMTSSEMTPEQTEVFVEVAEEIRREEREGTS